MKPRGGRLAAKIVLAVTAPLLFFGILELLLLLAGVRPAVEREDPFVGFAGSSPLFVADSGADGAGSLVTADNKLELFNRQRFQSQKAPGTVRVFCLGGSTTYGRPYRDKTSFCGWLRMMLPVIDPGRGWEVVNAGGISYASYRVARLMEELSAYEPDLFIVYTGHNEFLEERTYSSVKRLPVGVRRASAEIGKTRTATVIRVLMKKVGMFPAEASQERYEMPDAVNAKLDQSAGLDLYHRDDLLRQQILAHYRSSLDRVVELADAAGAGLIFVAPAANLRNSSPFKSQHTEGLGPSDEKRSAALLELAGKLRRQSLWTGALEALDEAIAIDPRHAHLHYERGRALFALGRHAEAKAAFERAREEDVCPLRALAEMRTLLRQVCDEAGVPLVDFEALLERDLETEEGHGILGEEDFLDHVHPTIDAHRRLALALVEEMRRLDMVSSDTVLSDRALGEIVAAVEAGIDQREHAEALASLAWTLDWAGKAEESRRLAFQALESGVETQRILLIAGRHLAFEGKVDEALGLFRRAVATDPLSPTPHYQIGLLAIGRGELEAAAAHFFIATVLWPHDAKAHEKLGLVLAERGRYELALSSLSQAQRRDPGRPSIGPVIAKVAETGRLDARAIRHPAVGVTRHASGVLESVYQTRVDSAGNRVLHGLHTEWSEDGNLSRFTEYVNGRPRGPSVAWEPRVVSGGEAGAGER